MTEHYRLPPRDKPLMCLVCGGFQTQEVLDEAGETLFWHCSQCGAKSQEAEPHRFEHRTGRARTQRSWSPPPPPPGISKEEMEEMGARLERDLRDAFLYGFSGPAWGDPMGGIPRPDLLRQALHEMADELECSYPEDLEEYVRDQLTEYRRTLSKGVAAGVVPRSQANRMLKREEQRLRREVGRVKEERRAQTNKYRQDYQARASDHPQSVWDNLFQGEWPAEDDE